MLQSIVYVTTSCDNVPYCKSNLTYIEPIMPSIRSILHIILEYYVFSECMVELTLLREGTKEQYLSPRITA